MFTLFSKKADTQIKDRGVLCSFDDFNTTNDLELLAIDEKNITLKIKADSNLQDKQIDLRFYDHKNVIQFRANNNSTKNEILSINIENLERKKKRFIQKTFEEKMIS